MYSIPNVIIPAVININRRQTTMHPIVIPIIAPVDNPESCVDGTSEVDVGFTEFDAVAVVVSVDESNGNGDVDSST